MQISEEEKQLEEELRKIWNSNDFVIGIFSLANKYEERMKILEFIIKAREMGDAVSSEMISRLALDMDDKREKRK